MIDRLTWQLNKNVLRHLDQRVLQINPKWSLSRGWVLEEIECCQLQEVWMEEETVCMLCAQGIRRIPLTAIVNPEIVPNLIKDRPRVWW